jgi:subtilisin family serine protease
MSREEEMLVQEIMPDSKLTEGFAVGNTNRGKIKQMKKKGLALKVLNTSVLTVNTPGITRTYKFSFKKGVPSLKSETFVSQTGNFKNLIAGLPGISAETEAVPAFYIITLDAPLLPVFRQNLEQIGLNILQRVPYDSYIVLVKDQNQLNELHTSEKFKFIRMINKYSVADTGFIVRGDHRVNPIETGVNIKLVIDLILHREEDAAAVHDFLGMNDIERIASYKNTIRIRVSPNPEMAYKLASNKFIQAIYEHIPPILHNNIARQIVMIDAEDTGNSFLIESGDGEIIAVADTGIDRDHPDFKDHIIGAVPWGRVGTKETNDPHGHGTHVTGSIIGNGNASGGQIRGIAPGAKVFFQSLLDENDQLCDLGLKLPELLKQAYEQGARIMNISWGCATESFYTFDSAAMDRFVYENQEMLVVVSAGNEAGGKEGIAVARFGTVGSPATTKNGLTVGASNSKRNNENPELIAGFSSRGPCKNDRRVKPDIVAPGTNILSTKSSLAPNRNFESFDANPSYVFLSGTSMATPIVSGAAALVREYYNLTRSYHTPSAALVKATLLNGTKFLKGEISNTESSMIPNNNEGYGRLDMSSTIPNSHSKFTLEFCDSFRDPSLILKQTGERRMFRLRLDIKTWIRVCMVFIDNPATGIQSDLDLIIALEGTTSKWAGNAGINAKDIYFSDIEKDFTNNMEIIRKEEVEPGSYIIDVVATNTVPEAGVGFALVVTTGDPGAEFSTHEI